MAGKEIATGQDLGEKSQGDMTLLQALKELLQTQKNSAVPVEVPVNMINVKLDGTNYGMWLSMIETYLAGKGKLGFVKGDKVALQATDAGFDQWKMQDSMVKGLILNSLDSSLIGNFHRYPTASEVWDALATTFFDDGDSSQIYDLQQKVNQLKQSGGSLENYYNELQGLWKEIDFRQPNP
ncbi:uncharacterized protein LOC144549317 [Carex rostrata]